MEKNQKIHSLEDELFETKKNNILDKNLVY